MSVNRILCTEESLLITLNKILTGRECISLPVFLLIKSSPSSGDVDNLYNVYIVYSDGDSTNNGWYGDFDNSCGRSSPGTANTVWEYFVMNDGYAHVNRSVGDDRSYGKC